MISPMQFNRQSTLALSSRKYAIVCHDAGAANILMSNDAANGFPAAYYLLSGPALRKWGSDIPSQKRISQIDDVIDKIDVLITGTGWASNVEHNARICAEETGLYSMALVDHWVNYRARFVRNNDVCLPNEILVVDDHALLLAQHTFPALPVSKINNRYLENAKKRVAKTQKRQHKNILYVLEPVHEDWGDKHAIDEEFQALDYFKRFLNHSFPHRFTQIRLRPHPSESKQKYVHWIRKHAHLPIAFDVFDDIETSIANADWVFGCESYGLIVALECGKPAFSTIPHWAPKARLPHKALRHLRDFLTGSCFG
ncbi:MAG: hypothetical protein AAGJ37_18045 [Pseudomonadota bacterium]